MGIQPGAAWSVQVAEVMGLDTGTLRGLTISAYVNESMTVTVQHMVTTEQAELILEIIADYELVLRKTTSEVTGREDPSF